MVEEKTQEDGTCSQKASGFDPSDPSTIDWLNETAVFDALQHHRQDCSEMENSDLHEMIVLLCGYYKPSDIRPVFRVSARKQDGIGELSTQNTSP